MSEIAYQAYEVFIQKSYLDPHIHVGSLLAYSDEIALLNARENFLRRDKAVSIWVVPQKYVKFTKNEDDFFARETDHSYREVASYTENGRLWRMFKEKSTSLEEIVEYVKKD